MHIETGPTFAPPPVEELGHSEWSAWHRLKNMKCINLVQVISITTLLCFGSNSFAGRISVDLKDASGENTNCPRLAADISSVEVLNGTLMLRTKNNWLLFIKNEELSRLSFSAESIAILLAGGADLNVTKKLRFNTANGYNCSDVGQVSALLLTRQL